MAEREAQKIDAEIAKLIAETSKINSENRFYPVMVAAALLGAGAAAGAAAIKLFL